MILTEYINYCNYTTGMSYASYISQVQVVCSMENCDVSPSTLTGCAGGPRATLGISGRGRPPWGTEDSMIIMVHQSIFWTHPI